MIRRIHVRMLLKSAAGQRETAERVHGMFADRCPVYRSLQNAIEITSELVFELSRLAKGSALDIPCEDIPCEPKRRA